MTISRKVSAFAFGLILIFGCRPPIDGVPDASASSIAGELRTSRDVFVRVHLPQMADAIAAPIVNAIARNVVGSAGVQLEIAAPISAFDAFQ